MSLRLFFLHINPTISKKEGASLLTHPLIKKGKTDIYISPSPFYFPFGNHALFGGHIRTLQAICAPTGGFPCTIKFAIKPLRPHQKKTWDFGDNPILTS